MQTLQPATTAAPPPVEIYCLGQLEILLDGAAIRIDGRGPRKPLELLGMLIAAGPHGTSIGAASDCLWPDADGFDGYRALITTVYRLRRLLGRHEAIRLGAGRIRLDARTCSVDAWRFERAIGTAGTKDQLRSVLTQYVGPFMEETENAWVVELRERLEKNVSRAIRQFEAAATA
jgi:LuxR family transcriptional regulator, maltose regulon positive regulatory protein